MKCIIKGCGRLSVVDVLCDRHLLYYRERCPFCGKKLKTEKAHNTGVCGYCWSCMGKPRRIKQMRKRKGELARMELLR